MTLEMLMAFTVSQDHARQEQVWEAIQNSWQKEPYQIRRMLTETTVRASDKRAQFVGIDAYEAAGGCVLRDLFQSDDGGWLQDPVLLDRLTAEKLKTKADEIAGEGWKWIEVAVSLPYDVARDLREISATPLDLTAEEQSAIEALNAECGRLEAEYEGADELPDEIDQRLGEIETALAAFDDRPVHYDPMDVAIAGAFISLHTDGTLAIDRGYVRPEDEAPVTIQGDDEAAARRETDTGVQPTVQRAVVTIGGQPTSVEEEEEEDGIKPLPERLVTELTAHRTLALRDAVGSHPNIAMTALLHKLVSDTFLHRPATGALEANVRQVHFPAQAEELKDSPSAQSVTDRHERWGDQVPADDEALWDWLVALDDDNRMELLAHCVSYGVNALNERPNPYGGSGVSEHGLKVRMRQADRLARATGLDMAQVGWRPTVGNYLGRVTKARILEAVREGAGDRATQLIDHMKKGDMAKEAERLLAGTGWLPEPLRLAGAESDLAEESADQDGGEGSLPAFLTGDDDEEDPADIDEDEETMIAAE